MDNFYFTPTLEDLPLINTKLIIHCPILAYNTVLILFLEKNLPLFLNGMILAFNLVQPRINV